MQMVMTVEVAFVAIRWQQCAPQPGNEHGALVVADQPLGLFHISFLLGVLGNSASRGCLIGDREKNAEGEEESKEKGVDFEGHCLKKVF